MDIARFRHMMPQTVTIEALSSRDKYGAPTYAVGKQYRARIVGKHELVTNAQGKEVTSTHIVYLVSNDDIKTTARITLPSDFDPRQPPIVSVGTYPDGKGVFARTLFLSNESSIK